MQANPQQQIRQQIPAPRSTAQTLLLFSGFGGVLFIATFVALGVVAIPYRPAHDAISALEFTSCATAQRINFIAFGILLIAFATALRNELKDGRGALAIPFFQLLSGITVIGDGIFIHEPLHLTCDLIAFNATLLVLFLFAWRFWTQPHWKYWSAYSIITAVLMMLFLTAFGFANHLGGPAGLMEKLATATRTLWSVLLTFRLLRGARL